MPLPPQSSAPTPAPAPAAAIPPTPAPASRSAPAPAIPNPTPASFTAPAPFPARETPAAHSEPQADAPGLGEARPRMVPRPVGGHALYSELMRSHDRMGTRHLSPAPPPEPPRGEG
ncbi:MAG: hypothetical protein Q4C10_11245 [Clostridia bacterium]|nr:hypothetical protein [Clostridia bacterium]